MSLAEGVGATVSRAMPGQGPYAVYCHIPFCASRCTYCDFFTSIRQSHLRDSYVEALCEETRQVVRAAGQPVPAGSLYLGGGTPSVLSPASLSRLVSDVRRRFAWVEGAEVTVEANPGDASPEWLGAAAEAGVNRLSLGMQAADREMLSLLGRRHSYEETRLAVENARRAGFSNISLDLIYGIPGQSMQGWRRTVEAALSLRPDHLSAYCLTLERQTPMERWVRRGLLEPPDADLAAEQYEWLEERLEQAGYVHYEISSWARGPVEADGQPRFACRHNLAYWLNRPYLGLGAGAHGYADGIRYRVRRSIAGYIERLQCPCESRLFPLSPAAASWRRVTPEEAATDSLLLGLRLTASGVEVQAYCCRHGDESWQRHWPTLERLAADGLVEWIDGGQRVRLSARGRLLANRVFREFV